MLTNLITEKENLVAFRMTGALTKKDYNFIIPVLEDRIKRFGKIDLFWEMVNSHGWDLEALWEDLKFDIKHLNHFRKVAIVGDKKWEEWMARLISPFTSAEVKYFYEPRREEAMDWLKS